MLIGSTPEELDSWKLEMHQYEKSKRTKKPFGKGVTSPVHHVTEKQVKEQQTNFNPILQTFKDPQQLSRVVNKETNKRARSMADQQKQQAKYQKEYDIVNLHAYYDEGSQPTRQRFNQVPLRTGYNILSNEPLPEYYFNNRALKLAKPTEKKILTDQPRDYNIVNNVYKEDNLARKEEEWRDLQKKQEDKYWRTHDYNAVNGSYYDQNKQETYQEELDKEMKEHGKAIKDKLPPSYVKRIPLVVDPSKQIPEEAKAVEQRAKNSKKRYQTKYIVQKEYEDRNFQDYLKKESVIKNRVHDLRVLQSQNKEFDIINLKDYNKQSKLQLYSKFSPPSTWDKVFRDSDKTDGVTFGKQAVQT